MEISLAFFVGFAEAAVCLGRRAGAVSGALVWFSFVCMVIIFSGFINRGQHGPGTDESPECRAEKIDGVKTASVNTVPLSSTRKSSRICRVTLSIPCGTHVR